MSHELHTRNSCVMRFAQCARKPYKVVAEIHFPDGDGYSRSIMVARFSHSLRARAPEGCICWLTASLKTDIVGLEDNVYFVSSLSEEDV